MTTKVSWYADKSGMVVGPRVHDSKLAEFAYSAAGNLLLAMKRVSGGTVSMQLLRVSELSVLELRNGAIIAEIFVWKVGDIPESSWALLDGPWNVLYAGILKPDEAKKAAASIVNKMPNSLFVNVSCSYGGALAAISDSVDFYES